MERIWSLLCCGNLTGGGRGSGYDGNMLLNPDTSRYESTPTTLHTAEIGGGGYHPSVEENEGTTLQILETIGQLEGTDEISLRDTLSACMDLIPSQHMRLYILNHLLDMQPKRNKLQTLRALIATLDSRQKSELASIVTGLPPSVFGDALAREQTRVLVDLVTDAKECSNLDKSRVAPQRKFVETIIEMFQQTLSPRNTTEQARVIAGVLHKQLPSIKTKVVLKQLVSSRCMQPAYSAREELMRQLLLEEDESSHHTTPNTTTSTTRTNDNNNIVNNRYLQQQPHIIEEEL